MHRGTALTSFYQCGDLYRVDPCSGDTLGKEDWSGAFPSDWGVSAHPKVDDRTGELLFFNYSQAGAVHALRRRRRRQRHWCTTSTCRCPARGCRTTWRSPRTTRSSTTFRCSGSPSTCERNVHVARFHRDMPSRFAVIPRRGGPTQIRWFEADPTYVLHFTNAYEDGDEIVLDGFFQGDPEPADNGLGDKWQRAFRFLALDRMQARLHRWRFNLVTGGVREEQLSDSITEFGMINSGYAGRRLPLRLRRDRASRAGSCSTAWSSTISDRRRGAVRVRGRRLRQRDGDGARGSGSTGEDDGYLVTHHHRHERRRLLLPGVRRGQGRRRPGMQTGSARTGFQRHAFDVGGRDRSCAAGSRPTPPPRRSVCSWTSRPTPSAACSGVLGDEWTLLIAQQALLGRYPVRRIHCAAADLECGPDQAAGSR